MQYEYLFKNVSKFWKSGGNFFQIFLENWMNFTPSYC